jgi:hypothetical protein
MFGEKDALRESNCATTVEKLLWNINENLTAIRESLDGSAAAKRHMAETYKALTLPVQTAPPISAGNDGPPAEEIKLERKTDFPPGTCKFCGVAVEKKPGALMKHYWDAHPEEMKKG